MTPEAFAPATHHVGGLLVDAGVVTEAQLEAALLRQREEGGRVGTHLVLSGAVNRLELYDALAFQWGAAFVDLRAEPPDTELLRGFDASTIAEQGWIPWRREAGVVVIATCEPPTAELLADAAAACGVDHVGARTTTDWDVLRATQDGCREQLLFDAGERLSDESSAESARFGITRWQLAGPPILVVVALVGIVLEPSVALAAIFAFANLVFAINVGFKVLAGLRAPWRAGSRGRWEDEVAIERGRRGLPPLWPGRTPDEDLPIYTILVPAFHEANVIQSLLRNLDALDYPRSKLDVLVLLEEDDDATIAAAKAMRPPEYVRIIEVPRGTPQSKPRACNYGTAFARGEFLVIFDAEDRPDPDQLRVAVAAFRRDEFEREHVHPDKEPLVCVQASLNYFNADHNVLTRMFAVEYAHWFDAMLPGLDGTGMPIPLGGTSNHFVTAGLRDLGAWDPYNVTEDADLGLRAAAHGYRVGTIPSTTWEEACSRVRPWVKQRTRWIKGYMMTAAVCMRHPIAWTRRNGLRGLVSLLGLIVATPVSFMLYPIVLGFTVATYIGTQFVGLSFPTWLLVAGTANMLAANGAMILAGAIAAWRRYDWRIAAFSLLIPAYWLLHATAAWRAAWQIVFRPHLWEKTPHGLSEAHEGPAGG